MRLTTPNAHRIIDLCGKRCPHLVIAIIAALQGMESGQVLQVIADDPLAPSSVGAWTRQSGHTLLDMYEEDSHFVLYLERASVLAPRRRTL